MNDTIKTVSIMSSGFLFILMGIASLPGTVAADKLLDIKIQAADECASIHETLNRRISEFENAENFKFIKKGVVTGGFTLPFVDALQVINIAKQKRDDWKNTCDAINKSDTEAKAKELYESLKSYGIRQVIYPAFSFLKKMEGFYARAENFGKKQAYISAFIDEADLDSFITPTEEKLLSNALIFMNAQRDFINANKLLVDAATFGKAEQDALEDLRKTDGLLSAHAFRLDAGRRQYDAVLAIMENILLKAAQAGTLTASLHQDLQTDKYKTLYKNFSGKAVKMCEQLKKTAVKEKERLKKIESALQNDLKNIDSNVSEKLSDMIKSKFMNELDDISAKLQGNCATENYTSALVQVNREKNLQIQSLVVFLVHTAKDFDSAVGAAKNINNEYQKFAGVKDLDGKLLNGLSAPDKQKLLELMTSMDNTYNKNLLPLLDTRKKSIEGKINEVTVASLDELKNKLKNVENIRSMVSDYNKEVAKTKSQFNQHLNIWYKLVRQAALEGAITLNTYPDLRDESIIARQFEDFEKRRDEFRSRARNIVESRILEIEKNKITILGLIDAPPDIKILEASDAIIAILKSHLIDKIDITNNYVQLKKEIEAIKDFHVNDIFIPLQRIFMALDVMYGKIKVLESVLSQDGLIRTRISELENGNEAQKNAASTLKTTYDGISASFISLKDTKIQDLKEAFISSMFNSKDKTRFTELKTKQNAAREELSSIVRQIQELVRQIRKAKSLQ